MSQFMKVHDTVFVYIPMGMPSFPKCPTCNIIRFMNSTHNVVMLAFIPP